MHLRRRVPTLETLELREVPAAVLPPGFTESVAAEGVFGPTAMEFSPDGNLYIGHQSGVMPVWRNGVQLSDNFFADQPLATDPTGERGLLGIAFDPNYANNRYVYVYYTTNDADAHNRVSRFTANAAGDKALAGSEVPIWNGDDHSGAASHNGGAIHFGPGNKLFIATGDGAANPSDAQSLASLHGKLLRINTDGTIPSDNPFVDQTTGKYQAIWALGLRNPFTFAFQPGTGQLFINDVGQDVWEEINVGVRGANYGWPLTQGNTGTPPTGPGNYLRPVYTYDHDGAAPNGVAITGAAFYNPATPSFGATYTSDYFFSDAGGGWIYRLNYDPATGHYATTPTLFASNLASPIDLKVDPAGNLYYLALAGGSVMIISATPKPAITEQPPSRVVSLGRPTVFHVGASGATAYRWQRADAATPNLWRDVPGAFRANYGLGTTTLGDNGDRFRVIVSNAAGFVISSAATLTVVRNQPPQAVITISDGLRNGRFDAGTPITFAGTATDAEDGSLDGTKMRWRVDYLTTRRFGDVDHDGLPGVTRPFVQPFTNATGGTFTPAATGPYTLADVGYVIRLSVTDSAGLTTNKTIVLLPNMVTITLRTSPPGLTLTLDGQPVSGPYTFTGVVGFQRTIGAAATQTAGVIGYQFGGWDDYGAATHTITTPTVNTSYLATYIANSVTGSIRYEAENLGRTNYFIEANPSASGGRLVAQRVGMVGAIRGAFQGPSGRYLIQLAYYDENDGQSSLSIKISGTQVAAWHSNKNLGSPNPDPKTRQLRYLGLRHLAQGMPFEIIGSANGGELARVDVIIFTKVQDNLVQAINSGGTGQGPYEADRNFDGGTAAAVAAAVSTTGVIGAAPASMYQTWREGDSFRYLLSGFAPGASYVVRLHFAEDVATAAGVNVFDVAINGTNLLADFDVFAAAGGRLKAVTREWFVTADTSGQLTLEFHAHFGKARVSAIEVFEGER